MPTVKHMYSIGLRVEVVKAAGKPFTLSECIHPGNLRKSDPHPEHIGKKGTITAVERVEAVDMDTPVITLDDGTILRGYECWWKPIKGKVKVTKPN